MIELYIDGRKVDLTTDISVQMNYELEKLQNPTIIKNNFSKTIQLQATPTNNNIFGYYYELDKVIGNNGFNAIQRIPFQLYRNNILIETGYIQLNNIKYINNNYVYEITLYGGLGDFFYNLSYDADGNDLSLADLNYGIGENDEDFEFQMNANTVHKAWGNSSSPANKSFLGGVVTFIPSYNGIYENFSNDKVLINTNNSSIFPSEMEDADYTMFTTINGYGYAELKNELTEWQIRDLRCYKQRPALRLQSFIEAICNPENNGGYEVELDEANFFNRDNTYYRDAWITLPLLNPDSEDFPTVTTTTTATTTNNTQIAIDGKTTTIPITICGQTTTTHNLASEYGNSSIDIDFDFSLMVNNQTTDSDILMTSKYVEDDRGRTQAGYGGIGVWLELKVDNQIIGVSDSYVFTKGLYKGTYKGNRNKLLSKVYTVPNVNDFDGYFNGIVNSNFYYFDGDFRRIGSTKNFLYSDVNNNNTFKLSLKNVPVYENMEISIKTQMFCSKLLFEPDAAFDNLLYRPAVLYTPDGVNVSNNIVTFSDIQLNSVVTLNTNRKTLQGVKVNKKQLLKNKITPASLLTSFTKLFGLYFVKDAINKKIKICTRNTFFKDAEVIDIDNKIDYSSEYKIEPLSFDKKWYLFTTPALETTQMKKYKGNYYEAEYGQKRINTNYNFNTDTEDLLKENKYQNVITMLDSSKYYRNFINNGIELPTFALDGCTYRLWKNYNLDNSFEKEYNKTDILGNNTPVQFNTLVGADALPKICCFDLDNDKQSLNDLNVSLVIFNGMQALIDSKGNNIYYTISNDIPLMLNINDGTPMYLWSTTEEEVDGDKICVRTNILPQFTRYNIAYGNVVDSLDFGLPMETYINVNYNENSTLYNSFWQKLFQDQFSENTRKVVAYVKFEDIQLGNHSLSNFYYFNKCYWLLNKIIDYDLANPYKKVKCEFIKINELSNYTNGQKVYMPLFEVSFDWDNVEDFKVVDGQYGVVYGGSWTAEFVAPYGIERLSINIDGVPENEIQNHYTLTNMGDKYTLTITDITGDVGVDIVGSVPTIIRINNYLHDNSLSYNYMTVDVNNMEFMSVNLNNAGNTSDYTTEDVETIGIWMDGSMDYVGGICNIKGVGGFETNINFGINSSNSFEVPTFGVKFTEVTFNIISNLNASENTCELEIVNAIKDEIRDSEMNLWANYEKKLTIYFDYPTKATTLINSAGIYDVYVDYYSRDAHYFSGVVNIFYWDGNITTSEFDVDQGFPNHQIIDENTSRLRKIQVVVEYYEN